MSSFWTLRQLGQRRVLTALTKESCLELQVDRPRLAPQQPQKIVSEIKTALLLDQRDTIVRFNRQLYSEWAAWETKSENLLPESSYSPACKLDEKRSSLQKAVEMPPSSRLGTF